MKEFVTIRYLIDDLRRQEREDKYLSELKWAYLRGMPVEPVKDWFNDSAIEVSESTKLLIQNIFKGKSV